MADPQVVSRAEWLTARKEFLAKEKEFTRQRDALSAERRRLPMTEVDQEYVFDGPDGEVSQGCPSCSFLTDNIGHLAHLHARDTTLALVSRAPLARIEPFRQRMEWTIPWYSSLRSDFNYDFHVTLDESVAPVEYNYLDLDELGPEWQGWSGELHGISAFLRQGGRVFLTYSSYARGTDMVNGSYHWLDLTARGRQEDWELPPGRSDGPLMAWLRHHDRYGE
jgi:predicted dithiol-disulfide oxidoreductase (DUF899 family)